MKTFKTVEDIRIERDAQRTSAIIYKLLGVLLGEIDRLPIPRDQSPSEDQIYAIVKKLYEGAELLASKDWDEEAKIEYAYLKDYIKKQLTEEEIISIITGLKANFIHYNIGMAMKYFKDNYPGQYDGKLVSKLAK